MNIGIDARLYGLEHAGIGRYIKNIVDRLLRLDSKHKFFLFLNQPYFTTLAVPANTTKVFASARHYSLTEQIVMPLLLNRYPLDLVHFPHFNVPYFYTRPFVMTIHDLLWHQQKDSHSTTLNPLVHAVKYAGYRSVVRHAVKKASAIIVPSRFIKNQLLAAYPTLTQAKNIALIYEAVDAAFTPSPSKQTLPPKTGQFITNHDYVVYVGSSYPHKNLTVLLRAMKLVNDKRRTPIKLVVCSARSIFLDRVEQQIKALSLQELVHIAGFLSDEQLQFLLAGSLALVQPSKSEGFGLTGLEAMSLGVPVIAAEAGSLPEVYGDAAMYFNPDDHSALAQNITRVVDSRAISKQLITAGVKQSQRFSWEKAAKQTLKLYQGVMKHG